MTASLLTKGRLPIQPVHGRDSRLLLEHLQPISNARLRDDKSGSRWIWLYLAAQVADIDLQHVGFSLVSSAPNSPQQLVMC
jgi:hypothetical protein